MSMYNIGVWVFGFRVMGVISSLNSSSTRNA